MKEEKNSSINCPIISRKTKLNNYKFFYKLIGSNVKIERRLYKVFVGAFFVIASIFMIEILSIIIGNFIEIEKNEKVTTMGIDDVVGILGPIGDFFGGMLNPILSFCTFMALLMTIVLQQKELSLTRKELSETQKATRDSARALEEQSKSIKLQNFENTFFKMLDLHNKIVDKFDGKKNIKGTINIKFKDKDEIIEKIFHCKNSFSGIYDEIKNKLNNYNRFDSYYIVENLENISRGNLASIQYWIEKELISCTQSQIEKIRNNLEEEKIKYPENQLDISNYIYTQCMKVLDNYLAHYLRNIYQILKLIDNNDFINDKKFYSNILRAQLNQDEQGILFHNCVSEFGIKMLPLFIKYEFLEHLTYSENFSKYDLKFYIDAAEKTSGNHPSKAFGKNEQFAKACAKILQENTIQRNNIMKIFDKTNTSSSVQQ